MAHAASRIGAVQRSHGAASLVQGLGALCAEDHRQGGVGAPLNKFAVYSAINEVKELLKGAPSTRQLIAKDSAPPGIELPQFLAKGIDRA